MENKYRFNNKLHLHELLIGDKWRALTGCTTILSVIAKPWLIQWAVNMAMNYVKDKENTFYNSKFTIGDSGKHFDLEALYTVLEEAKTAHSKRKKKAGDYGTKIHSLVELIITNAIEKNGGFIKNVSSKNKSIQNFIDWANINKIKFITSEKNVYSENLFLGGIVDFVCEMDGQVWIGDIKTSKSGVQPINFAQIAGYELMMKEMNLSFAKDIKGYIVINLKESGEFDEKRSVSNINNKKFFLACLEIYRQQERIKTQI